MKRKIALFMILAMLISLVPMNVFAASTLTTSKVISVADDAKLTLANAPRVKIEENAINEFTTTTQTFLVTLSSNSDWLVVNSGVTADTTIGELSNANFVAAMIAEQPLLQNVSFTKYSDQEAQFSFNFAAIGTVATGKELYTSQQ